MSTALKIVHSDIMLERVFEFGKYRPEDYEAFVRLMQTKVPTLHKFLWQKKITELDKILSDLHNLRRLILLCEASGIRKITPQFEAQIASYCRDSFNTFDQHWLDLKDLVAGFTE